jgi:hypothetical protein
MKMPAQKSTRNEQGPAARLAEAAEDEAECSEQAREVHAEAGHEVDGDGVVHEGKEEARPVERVQGTGNSGCWDTRSQKPKYNNNQ